MPSTVDINFRIGLISLEYMLRNLVESVVQSIKQKDLIRPSRTIEVYASIRFAGCPITQQVLVYLINIFLGNMYPPETL